MKSHRHYVLALLVGIYIVNFVDRFVISIVLEPIKHTFNLSDAWLGLLSGFGFAVFYATLGIPIAYAADRHNRRNIISGAVALFGLATMACGMVTSLWQLILARLVVGIGEAGTSPPSHSIISDLYAPHERATAMGVMAMGANLGLMVAFFGGGWVTEHVGWRYTFIVAGAPGIALAILLRLTTSEPKREQSASAASAAPVNISSIFIYLMRRRSFLHIAFGGALNGVVGYSAMQWIAPFLTRAHGLSPTEIGMVVGLIVGIAGATGAFMGGFVSNHLAKTDVRWLMWFPGLVMLAATPFFILFYQLENTSLALACFILPAASGSVVMAPALAASHGLVPPRMRAFTSAILLFIFNMIGLSLGPLMVGVISDLVQVQLLNGNVPAEEAGATGLRWALTVCALIGPWSAYHCHLATKSLRQDLDRIGEPFNQTTHP